MDYLHTKHDLFADLDSFELSYHMAEK